MGMTDLEKSARQALEALEYLLPDTPDQRMKKDNAITALRRALEQPAQQELVAWVNANSLQGLTLGHYAYAEIYTDESAGRIPLYTHPQAREPLTDEEIKQCTGASDAYWASSKLFILAIARSIEAAHGIGEKK